MKNHGCGIHEELWAKIEKGNFHVSGSYNDGAVKAKLRAHGGRCPSKVREYIVRFIIDSNNSHNSVDNDEFKNLLFQCGLDSPVPCRETIRTDILKLHQSLKGKVQEFVRDGVPGKVSLTFDCWDADNDYVFLTVNMHWIDSSWQKQILTLGFEPLQEGHSGDILLDSLSVILDRYDLHGGLHCITSDNASENISALNGLSETFDWPTHFLIRCQAHALNLACKVLYADPTVAAVRAKLKRQIKQVKTGNTRIGKFKRLCREAGVKYVRLEQDNVTRWSSTWQMFRNAYEMRHIFSTWNEKNLKAVLADKLAMSPREWQVIQDCRDILRPFWAASVESQHQVTPTLPQACGLYEELLNLLENTEMPIWAEGAVAGMKEKLEKYYGFTSYAYYVATLLDPRYKLRWASEKKRPGQESYKTILANITPFLQPYLKEPHLERLPQAPPCASAPTLPPPQENVEEPGQHSVHADTDDVVREIEDDQEFSARRKKTLSSILAENSSPAQQRDKAPKKGKVVKRPLSESTTDVPLQSWQLKMPTVDLVQARKRQKLEAKKTKKGMHPELEAYLQAPTIPVEDCPLQWWKQIGEEAYPGLARAAINFLATPATTASSERCFSQGRQVVTFDRHQLSEEMIEATMCLKSWIKFF
jgi:hypothetical protein